MVFKTWNGFLLLVYFCVCMIKFARNQTNVLQDYGYEQMSPNKYALLVRGSNGVTFTYQHAETACSSHLPGATLFTANNAGDSAWLGERINIEKDFLSGSSKFWVGLHSQAPASLFWIDGTGYIPYSEVVQTSGFDDPSKSFAWAVPDGGTGLKYEFLTSTDEADGFVCQYSL